MELKLKQRQSEFCNLKAMLIFLWYLPALAVWSMIGAVWWLCRMHWKLLGSKWIKLLFIIITIAGTCFAGTKDGKLYEVGADIYESRGMAFAFYEMILYLDATNELDRLIEQDQKEKKK